MLVESTGIGLRSAEAFLEAFTFDEEKYDEKVHAFPYGAQPPASTPIYRVGGGYLIPVPMTFRDAIRPRMEDLLSQHPSTWRQYLDYRGAFVEEEATRILAQALPGSTFWTRLPWDTPTSSGELDGLVACDDVALRIQAKSGRVSPSARRGSQKRILKDLGDIIGKAAKQHQALHEALAQSDDLSLGFQKAVYDALNLPIQIEIVTTLDDIMPWSPEHHKLRRTSVLQTERPMPWVVSLMDLMVVCDVLAGADFLDFLWRRLRLEEHKRISSIDELDYLGCYLDSGLYFDDSFTSGDSPDFLHLAPSYTETLDTWYFHRAGIVSRRVEKPRQDLPPNLRNLIEHLKIQRPPHWLFGSVCLLIGDQESKDLLEDTYIRLASRPADQRMADTSHLFPDWCGVTLMINHTLSIEIAALQGRVYAKNKMEQHNMNWVAIVGGRAGQLKVITIPEDGVNTIWQRLRTPAQTGT